MAKKENFISHPSSRMELMKVTDNPRHSGMNFHVYLRNNMPSSREFPLLENEQWQSIREEMESTYEWLPEHRFEWNEIHTNNQKSIHYGLHLIGGVTCYRSDATQSIQVIYDHESDEELVKEIMELLDGIEQKSNNQVGLIQMSYGTLNVKFVEYRPYELDITPFLGEEITGLKKQMLQNFEDETKSGLYLIHGKPGTGKTSFLKEILNRTDKKALFIPPSIAGELGNPNLISLLMDHANSILIIEDAETVLMKREADNSDSVSNLLNLTDGFPSDFLNLNIICTFNTDIGDIDPALLRKGRLRGIQEFRELSIENARKLADTIESDITIDRKMTVAEVCNENSNNSFKQTENGIGFNGNR